MQELKQPCGLNLIRSISKKNTENQKVCVTLPEALLFMDRQTKDEVVETVDLAQEELISVFQQLNTRIDRVIDC